MKLIPCLYPISHGPGGKFDSPRQGAFFGAGSMVVRNRWGKRMGMLAHALSDHLKEIAWALLLIFLFLACLFVIFGRELGFDSVLWVCLGFAVIVLGLFGMLILGELLWTVIWKVFRRLFPKNE
jgi:hypothetical protein